MATSPVTPTPVTAGPPVPDIGDHESTFDSMLQAFHAWQKDDLQPEINTLASQTYTNAVSASDSASAAALSQSAASTSAAASSDSATLAQGWATSLTVVSGGLYGAKYYAQQAQAAVAVLPDGTINDLMIAADKTWSSAKIDSAKQNTLVSGDNIKTVNSQSIVGAGNLDVSDTKTGDIRITYATSMPAGWVRCDEAAYLKTSYAAVAALVGSLVNRWAKSSDVSITNTYSYPCNTRSAIAVSGSNLFAASHGATYWYSTNGGSSWTEAAAANAFFGVAVAATLGKIVASVRDDTLGGYRLRSFDVSNMATSSDMSISSATSNWEVAASNTFVIAYNYYAGASQWQRSTNGTSWVTSAAAPWGSNAVTLCSSPSAVFASAGASGIWKTTTATAWTACTACGLSNYYLHYANGKLIAQERSTLGGQIKISDDDGATWRTGMRRLPRDAQHQGQNDIIGLKTGFLLKLSSGGSIKLYVTYEFIEYVEVPGFATSQTNFRAFGYCDATGFVVCPAYDSASAANALKWSPYTYDSATQFVVPLISNGWIKT